MPLATGTRLGPYEIRAPLGAGGMGEIYRATDTRLDREVAIKVLAESLSSNADFRQRFEREAKAISALNHPHICTLYDVGSQNGLAYLVLELVEGETLAQRLARGPLPLKDALRHGAEIADALDRAHRQGIVHRDLKPGNVMLTKAGAKLLDFGLAKPRPPATTPAAATASGGAATMSSPLTPITEQGTVLGTVQYMSPEQIEGREADARSDIFSLGCVLYEMLTGRRAFEGSTNWSVASAILERDPAPISAVQPLIPPHLNHVVRRALAKSPDERWQSASDVRGELQWIAAAPADAVAPPPRHRWRQALPWAVALLALIAAAAVLWRTRQTATVPVVRAAVLPPEGGHFAFSGDLGSRPEFSPDGRRLAFAAKVGEKQAIYIRDLDGDAARMVPGTDGGFLPFWSFDGQQLGYFSGSKLSKVNLQSGVSTALAAVAIPKGGSWGPDGTILFVPSFRSPVLAISSSGGDARPVTTLDTAQHTTHRYPVFLPDGEHFLYLAANHRSPSSDSNALYVGSLRGDTARRLRSSVCNAAVVDGYLFFCHEEKLFAQPLDLETFALRGEPQPLARSILTDPGTWGTFFGATDAGLFAYYPGQPIPGTELVWLNRDGKRIGTIDTVRDYVVVSLSRNGKRLAVEVNDGGPSTWIADLERKTLSRLTFSGVAARRPVINPDGSAVAFSTGLGGTTAIIRKSTSGAGADETLLAGAEDVVPNAWSPDGKYLIVQRGEPAREYGLFALQLSGARKLVPMRVNPGEQSYDGDFSPDMKWFVYTSPENGREEVFVSPFDPDAQATGGRYTPPGRWQISAGGNLAQWSHDGKEIYYVSSDVRMMAAAVDTTGGTVRAGTPRELFRVDLRTVIGMSYAVAPDGRFLVNTSLQPLRSPLQIVTDWHTLIGR